VLLLIGVLGLTVYILLTYPSKSTPIYAYVFVSISLLFSLGIVMLLPYDVYLVTFILGSQRYSFL
jgi:hypothetical protein